MNISYLIGKPYKPIQKIKDLLYLERELNDKKRELKQALKESQRIFNEKIAQLKDLRRAPRIVIEYELKIIKYKLGLPKIEKEIKLLEMIISSAQKQKWILTEKDFFKVSAAIILAQKERFTYERAIELCEKFRVEGRYTPYLVSRQLEKMLRKNLICEHAGKYNVYKK